jgi:hypothetical protein
MRADPKRAKNKVKPSVLFVIFGSAHVKALLMKLKPGVNFINILRTAFALVEIPKA